MIWKYSPEVEASPHHLSLSDISRYVGRPLSWRILFISSLLKSNLASKDSATPSTPKWSGYEMPICGGNLLLPCLAGTLPISSGKEDSVINVPGSRALSRKSENPKRKQVVAGETPTNRPRGGAH